MKVYVLLGVLLLCIISECRKRYPWGRRAYGNYMRYYQRQYGRINPNRGYSNYNVINSMQNMPQGVYDNYFCNFLGKSMGKRSTKETRIVGRNGLDIPDFMQTDALLRQYAVASFGQEKINELEKTLKRFFNARLETYLKTIINQKLRGYSFEAIRDRLFRSLLSTYRGMESSGSVNSALRAIKTISSVRDEQVRQHTDAFDKSNCYQLSYYGRMRMCSELQFAMSLTKFCGVSNVVSMLYNDCSCGNPGDFQQPAQPPAAGSQPYPPGAGSQPFPPAQPPSNPQGQPYPPYYQPSQSGGSGGNQPPQNGGSGGIQPTVNPPPPFPDGCGLSNLNPARDYPLIRDIFRQWRIVGGVTAKDGEFPWVVVVNVGSGLCAGSILNSTTILTAAHCIEGFEAQAVTVDVSEHDRFNDNDHVTFKVSKVMGHPNYQPGTEENDLALLTLATPIDFNTVQGAAPICLPTGDFANNFPDGTDCIVAGWGTVEYQGDVPNVLQQVSVPTYRGTECNEYFNTDPTLPSKKLCAGVPGTGGLDSCQGDSGAPLFCSVRGRWVQYGIVSFGDGCANPGEAGVYTAVSQYLNFIGPV